MGTQVPGPGRNQGLSGLLWVIIMYASRYCRELQSSQDVWPTPNASKRLVLFLCDFCNLIVSRGSVFPTVSGGHGFVPTISFNFPKSKLYSNRNLANDLANNVD